MAPRPAWILKAPRVILVLVFPFISFILYLILLLGCITDSLSTISPVVVRSNGPVTVGGSAVRVDLRVGFWGVCFGPAPFDCTSSVSVSRSKSANDVAREIASDHGGGNVALANLALGLQANFAMLSGIFLLILLIADIIANLVQLYFNSRGTVVGELHTKAALWARSLDWAAAAGAVTSFTSYQTLVSVTPNLIRVLSPTPLTITVGMMASNLFAAVVGTTIAGAAVNTFLTARDAAWDTRRALKARGQGPGESPGGIEMDTFKPVYRERPAYEVFP
ncbi:hypothetical protein B0T26DRAFT_246890 [Lasiosphaeria miniovina]|uniref:Uncharacterized protein n=1 Tax=Lasiosphaeria miniovina TaxID=1954250 RepID=A0AA40AW02_9PEZI|nr:uncharacterized protein B0T26DRAFT_246890 [Lasiosphaeria miniovina]KAK0723058.1 hypothetical protein B0T26DRAFT_246890 [Lasiosphaeria miniovina]